jgi:hypothetical protein
MSNNPLDAAKGFLGNIQEKAGEMAEGLIGEENLKKVTDALNTDVGAMAKDAAGNVGDMAKNAADKAEDVVEKVTGIDLDGKPGA